MSKIKSNIPKKGAGRRLAEKLEHLGKLSPPRELVNKLNNERRLMKIKFFKSFLIVTLIQFISLIIFFMKESVLNG